MGREPAGRRRRTLLMTAVALGLFGGVLSVSRVVDLGILEARELGVGDHRRQEVELSAEILASDGQRRALSRDHPLRAGDRLLIAYGRTRYPYLRVFAIDENMKARTLVPPVDTSTSPYGHHTANRGERLVLTPPYGASVMVAVFSAVPRRFGEIERAVAASGATTPRGAALDMHLPGRRFVFPVPAVDSGR